MKKIIALVIICIYIFACPVLPDDHINKGCNKSSYTFDIPVSFAPTDSIINIGDTIMITSYIPLEKWDSDSNYIFIFDSVNFHMGGGIIKLDTLIEKGKQYNFIEDFNFEVDSVYNWRQGSNSYSIDFYYSQNEYNCKIKMIPKKPGLYLFDFNSLITASHSVKAEIVYTKNDDCYTDSWSPYFKTNKGFNYKELLKQSPNEYYTGYYYQNWSRYNTIYGAHCFKVE